MISLQFLLDKISSEIIEKLPKDLEEDERIMGGIMAIITDQGVYYQAVTEQTIAGSILLEAIETLKKEDDALEPIVNIAAKCKVLSELEEMEPVNKILGIALEVKKRGGTLEARFQQDIKGEFIDV